MRVPFFILKNGGMSMFSAGERKKRFAQMAENKLDLLVIGGGITGAGIALDAVSRGLRVGLIEMQDFAAGTSSRSTKLVHGGLRYLKQFEFRLVSEVGRERAIVYQNAPHVTTPLQMLLPIVRGGTFGRFSTSLGLLLYDRLANVKKSERRKMLNKSETLAKEPLLKEEGLKGSGCYVEYRTDDARLVIEVLKKAAALGALAVNYVKAVDFTYQEDTITGVIAKEMFSGEEKKIEARKVVNAAGPWVDELREMDGSKNEKQLHLTKGVHLTVDGKRFPLQSAVYFDAPDGRMIFAIPRDNKTYIGTTDTDYSGDLENPQVTTADRDYLLKAVNAMFPSLSLQAEDVESGWAGLRPLIHEKGKGASEISRRDEMFQSPSGLITIAGGKLTGYRKMAERVVDEVMRQLEKEGRRPFISCQTENLVLSGGDFDWEALLTEAEQKGRKLGLAESEARLLAKRYGSNAAKIFEIIGKSGRQADRYGLPRTIFATLLYAIEEECAATISDFFIRRTAALFFDIATVKRWKEPAVHCLAERLNLDQSEREEQLVRLQERIDETTPPVK